MQQNNTMNEIGLNIHLLTFKLPNNLVHDADAIRVSITTMPEERKQHFQIKGKKMYCSNHVFSLNITNKTDRIIMVFRKKSFINSDPIIASTIIYLKDFIQLPIENITSGTKSTDVKILYIFYPLQKQMSEEATEKGQSFLSESEKKAMKRKILGQMEVQLSLTTPYANLNKNKSKKNNNKKESKISTHCEMKSHTMKIDKKNKQKKNGDYKQISEDNCYINYYLM